jgi:peptide/nickel transport system substrate-binding protein
MRSLKAAALVSVLLFGLTSCSPSTSAQPGPAGNAGQAEQPKSGGVLKVAIQNFDPNLDPITSRTGYSSHVTNVTYDKLIDIDVNSNLAPGLATEWQFAPDAKSLTMKLRQGVKFQDGKDFNADAAKLTIDRARDPKESNTAGTLQSVDKVEVVDPYTLRVTMSTPDVSIPFAMFLDVFSPGAIVTGADGKKTYNPIGSGPFKLESVTADRVSLVKFDNYWNKGSVYLDQIQFFKITDPIVRLSALRAGDVDVIEAPSNQDIDSIKKDQSLGYLLRPGNINYRIAMRVDMPPFDNVNLRRAMSYAIDRDAVNKVAFFGTGTVNQNFMYPGHWAYDPTFTGLPYDLDKARDELRKGGHPDGFKFSITVVNREPELTVAQAVKAQIVKVGIDMEIVPEDSTKSFESIRNGTYPARHSGGSRGAEPVVDLQEFYGPSPTNTYGYHNAEADKLIDLMRTNPDQKARIDAMKRLNVIFAIEDPITIRMVEAAEVKAWNAKVRGVKPAYSYPFRLGSVWLSDTPKPGPVS